MQDPHQASSSVVGSLHAEQVHPKGASKLHGKRRMRPKSGHARIGLALHLHWASESEMWRRT